MLGQDFVYSSGIIHPSALAPIMLYAFSGIYSNTYKVTPVEVGKVTIIEDYIYCEYCGSKNNSSGLKCQSCGASL